MMPELLDAEGKPRKGIEVFEITVGRCKPVTDTTVRLHLLWISEPESERAKFPDSINRQSETILALMRAGF